MPSQTAEVVTISRRRLAELERDREILDVIEASHGILHPEAPPYRDQIGDLLDAGMPARAIWTPDAKARRRAAQAAALRVVEAETPSRPSRTAAVAAIAAGTPEHRRRAGR